MPFERACGTLLHITSLPSPGGIGDLGAEAYRFADFLQASGQSLWQVLPIGPVGSGNSPYSAISAFAGNRLLISLDRLAERGWIDASELRKLPDGGGHVSYGAVREAKLPILRRAAEKFVDGAPAASRKRFEEFCWLNGWWLEDYVQYAVLRQVHGQKSWMDWPDDQRRRESKAIEKLKREHERDLTLERAMQFFFFEQWRALRQYCNARGIRFIGDVAIFVSLDSSDVWTHPDIFELDADLKPISVSGVPPDFFSETGQRWGNPLYRWDALRERGYDWWIQRMKWALQQCDIVRLDHFRGFEAYWEIPASEETAVNGRWVQGPNHDFFSSLRVALDGKLPLIAEDLGTITPEVDRLRRDFEMPGMRILQFGFGNPGAHIYLPHKFERDTVVYTGTHDNDTTAGWWQSSATAEEKKAATAYLQPEKGAVHWAFVRAAMGSVADLCIIPMQDWLGLGSEHRMNVPSRPEDNWTWRLESGAIRDSLPERIRELAEVSDRLPASAGDKHSNREVSENFAA